MAFRAPLRRAAGTGLSLTVTVRGLSKTRPVRPVGAFRALSSSVPSKGGAVPPSPAPSADGTVPSIPIEFEKAAKIEGGDSQIVVVDLLPGQALRAESGNLIYMSEGVEMDTSATGGISAGFARYMAGGSVFLSSFRYTGESGSGTVALGTDVPSKIMKLNVNDYEGGLMAQKGAFLAGSDTIDIEMGFSKSFTAGFFGGEGFVLQKLTGEGDCFVKATGALINKELKVGEKLRVTSGSIVAFEGSVEYDVEMQKGMKNVVFGGEGLFITTLTGPGRVYLQGMQFDR
eukprot:CAMPEP_0205912516 /NCGR_PEP_ID=MMETSP1325-20131115/5893_1 /ASSEMBLY_ACC=CAM_ASM_000708 /TAXON_ID=236786 /ORGANISM="Florenciella sp., Strain RCC1007" /LENGTH=286 /DNA_ID=CAMNT_0053279223 /DNA_START=22 /DNA_END=882 /DNA_ORIENTATION=-